MKEFIKRCIILLALVPIEFIALLVDYNTYTMWGYIPFIFILVVMVMNIKRTKGLKKLCALLLARALGGVISFVLITLSPNSFILTDYFKPLTTSGMSITYSVISIIVMAIAYKVIDKVE